jgi:hypothetical protein
VAAPVNVTGDRLDRVRPGQFVHLAPLTLSGETPADGWLEVAYVDRLVDDVAITFADDDVATLVERGDRLVRIGDAVPDKPKDK